MTVFSKVFSPRVKGHFGNEMFLNRPQSGSICCKQNSKSVRLYLVDLDGTWLARISSSLVFPATVTACSWSTLAVFPRAVNILLLWPHFQATLHRAVSTHSYLVPILAHLKKALFSDECCLFKKKNIKHAIEI